jgi:hypothetical protein
MKLSLLSSESNACTLTCDCDYNTFTAAEQMTLLSVSHQTIPTTPATCISINKHEWLTILSKKYPFITKNTQCSLYFHYPRHKQYTADEEYQFTGQLKRQSHDHLNNSSQTQLATTLGKIQVA